MHWFDELAAIFYSDLKLIKLEEVRRTDWFELSRNLPNINFARISCSISNLASGSAITLHTQLM